NAGTVVAHRHFRVRPVAAQLDDDGTAIGGELHRVVEQVAEHLQQARAVAVHPGVARRHVQAQQVVAAHRFGLGHFHRAGDDAGQVHARGGQADLSAGDAADVEQVVDEPGQLGHLAVDDVAATLDVLRLDVFQLHHRYRIGDRRQRVAEFMAEHRQERGHALALVFQRLDPALVGQVAGDLGETQVGAVGLEQRGDGDAGPEATSVLAHAPAFVLHAAFGQRD